MGVSQIDEAAPSPSVASTSAAGYNIKGNVEHGLLVIPVGRGYVRTSRCSDEEAAEDIPVRCPKARRQTPIRSFCVRHRLNVLERSQVPDRRVAWLQKEELLDGVGPKTPTGVSDSVSLGPGRDRCLGRSFASLSRIDWFRWRIDGRFARWILFVSLLP